MKPEPFVRLTVDRVASELGVSRATVRRWESQGLVAARRDWRGGRVFDHADLPKLREMAGLPPKGE